LSQKTTEQCQHDHKSTLILVDPVLCIFETRDNAPMQCQAELWSRSPRHFGWLQPEPKIFYMVEPEPKIWVPVQATYANNSVFFLFCGPNYSGAGAKN